MKTNLVLLAAVLGLAFLGINSCQQKKAPPSSSLSSSPPPPPPPCIVTENKTWESSPGHIMKWTISYVCNEVIFNPNVENPDMWRAWLDSLHFQLVDTCTCPGKLELYRHDDTVVDGVAAGDVVSNPPPAANGVGKLSLNYVLPDPELTDFTPMTFGGAPVSIIPNPLSGPIVRVAIVDSGVDIRQPSGEADPQEFLFDFLWQETKQACNVSSRQFGVDVALASLPAPSDLHGHGTHINGIVAGYPEQAESPFLPGTTSPVRLQLLNVKYTVGATKSGKLFDAVCGMYYALEEQARVINLSWGYLDTAAPVILKPFLDEARTKNVVIVAAIGNKIGILEINDNLRFWPAGFAPDYDNMISVGAADDKGRQAGFSNWSDKKELMNVVAPGEKILSTYPKMKQTDMPVPSGIAKNSGTSMAAPFVTRTVALMIGKRMHPPARPNYKASLIKAHLLKKANPNRYNSFITFWRFKYDPEKVLSTW